MRQLDFSGRGRRHHHSIHAPLAIRVCDRDAADPRIGVPGRPFPGPGVRRPSAQASPRCTAAGRIRQASPMAVFLSLSPNIRHASTDSDSTRGQWCSTPQGHSTPFHLSERFNNRTTFFPPHYDDAHQNFPPFMSFLVCLPSPLFS